MHRLIWFLFFLFTFATGYSQYEYLSFSDFHIHPTYKHYNRPSTADDMKLIYNSTRYNPNTNLIEFDPDVVRRFHGQNWDNYLSNKKSSIKDLKKGTISNLRNYDQASYAELKFTPGSVLCASFYPYEKQFALTCLQRVMNAAIVTKMGIKRLNYYGTNDYYPLKDFMSEYFYMLMQDSVRWVSVTFPKKLYDENADSHYEQFSYYSKIKLVRDHDELKSNIDHNAALCKDCDHSKDTIITSMVLSIEGAQVLYGPQSGSDSCISNPWNVIRDSEDSNKDHLGRLIEKELLDNVHFLRNLPNRLFFITLGHFAQNHVAGFAKTIDRDPENFQHRLPALLSNSSYIRNNVLAKKYYGGLNLADSLGYRVIEAFLNPDSSIYKKPTYIDVKHMDVKARIVYYIARRRYEKQLGVKIPIIASHFAISGENQAMAAATGLYPIWDQYAEVEDSKRFYNRKVLMNDNTEERERYWKHVMEGNCKDGWCFEDRMINGVNILTGLDPFERSMYKPLFSKAHSDGLSYDPFSEYHIKDNQSVNWFYSWSINLFDEEIIEIDKSDGIIGLLLDPRQLGAFTINFIDSYPSLEKQFGTERKLITSEMLKSFYLDSNDLNAKEYLKCEPLLRNIFYIVWLVQFQQATEAGSLTYPDFVLGDTLKCTKDPWNLIALGSDFDGLIDPIDFTPTASYLPLLHRRLIAYAYIFARIHNDIFHLPNSSTPLITDLPDSQKKIRKIFFENARDFMIKYF